MQSQFPINRRGASRLSLVIGAVVALLILGFVITSIRSKRLTAMTSEDFQVAHTNWDSKNLANYEITVEVSGMQPGVYEVVVENGVAISAKFDGRDLTRPRTFGTWAVTGMFDTLARDLETNDRENYLMLGAEFDPEFGIPMKYQRIEMRTGAHDALQWQVTRFEPGK